MKNAKISKVRAAPKAANPAPSARKKTAAPGGVKGGRARSSFGEDLIRLGRKFRGTKFEAPPR